MIILTYYGCNKKQAGYKIKYEVASELGVPLSDGYNSDLTSKQNGSVGGYMVKNVCSIQSMEFERHLRSVDGHCFNVLVDCAIVV